MQPGNPPSSAGNSHMVVADSENFRVLIYDAPFTTGASASVVLGQPDFSTRNEPNIPTASQFGYPVDVAVDGSGDIWVADSMGSRVVEFKPPFTNGMVPSLVISGGYPSALAFDRKGNLWVADVGNVAEFTPPFTSGMQASVVIGAYTSCDPGPYHLYIPPSASANTFCGPSGIAFDATGDLWVSDFYDLRVLEFVPPFTTGMNASLELGQPAATAFTSNSSQPLSATSLCGAEGLAWDSSGNLWVADAICNRVLEYAPPFSNGMAASLVLGQPDFTHGANELPLPPPEPNTLTGPSNLWFDRNGDLMISDGGTHSRVVIFTPPFSTGMDASAVIGQPNMTTVGDTCEGSSGTAGNSLCFPDGGVTY